MQIMKYRFLFFHVNTNTISLTSISNKRLKLVNAKAVKQKKLTTNAATVLGLSSTQQ